MTEVPLPPTRALLLGAALAKWSLRLVALGWLLVVLVWGALHFVIVPRIDDLRPWLEQQASRRLGVAVRIGSIEAYSNGLIPSVALHDVQIFDAQGRSALALPSVIAALSPRSLAAGGLEQLYIDRPVLDVRRASDGALWIAGFEMPSADVVDGGLADWLMSQPEFAIRHGTVRWSDALRDAPMLELMDVDLVLRNRHFGHALGVHARPPAHWGGGLNLQGVFKQPLWTTHPGRWKDWSGQLYTALDGVDLGQLRTYMDVGLALNQGRGSLRAWVDVQAATVTGATADVLLSDVHLGPASAGQPVVLSHASGRLAARAIDGGHEYSTQGLQFVTADGMHWPGGNARLSLWDASAPTAAGPTASAEHGELVADRLDLAALSQLAQRLPLEPSWRTALESFKPVGVVQTLQASWKGPVQSPRAFAAKGRVTQSGLAAHRSGTPGWRGMDVDFDLTELAGKGHLEMANGALDLGAHWAEPVLPLAHLSADLQWKKDGQHLALSASGLHMANADFEGEGQVKWTNTDATGALTHGPGVVDVQATLSRADMSRVYRYLPQEVDKEVRDYLHDAVRAGTATAGKVKVKGDLQYFPFAQTKQGEFRISATVANGQYAYVPPSLLPKGRQPWPVLTQLAGELVIDHTALYLNGVRALWGGMPVQRADAVISNLYNTASVSVSAQGRSPLADALGVVNNSAVGDLTDHALGRVVANGAAEYRVKLDFPLADTDRMAVAGSVTLLGNDIQVLPATPKVLRARGQIGFTESGVTVNGVVGRALGGDVRVDGNLSGLGSVAAPAAPSSQPNATPVAKASPGMLRLQGVASAEGLRQAAEWGSLAGLAHYASGSAAYQANLLVRDGGPDLVVTSNLVGMALNLPAPFAKESASALPLRLALGSIRGTNGAAIKGQEQWQASLGNVASLALVQDSAGETVRVLRGALVVGAPSAEPPALPTKGVSLRVVADVLDVDNWTQVFDGTYANAASATGAEAPKFNVGQDFLPSALSLHAREISWGSRTLHNVNLSGTRAAGVWRNQVDAAEFSGLVEYRQPSAPALNADKASTGRLYARLSRLTIGANAAQDVESLLDEQPAGIPALDVVVEDFELLGKKLGRLEVEAINQTTVLARDPQREWLLKRFNLSTPEAVLNASGSWRLQPTAVSPTAAPAAKGAATKDRRRTNLDFKLDIADSGDLLSRFGMKDVVRKGKGKIEGQVGWQGSPITLDYPSMGGSFNVSLENGQFLKADPGIAKLLGVLSLQSLPRRLLLDFRDVFAEGFAFDFVRGDVTIAQGIARTNNLQMKGVTAAVLMEGSTDIAKETQSIKVVVVPEINAGGASLIATTINPIVGLSTFLAQLILRRPLIEASTQELYIDGTWLEPRVNKVERGSSPPTPAKPGPAKTESPQ
ncbi:MAG: YhdP family protein [Betaproteobacteria bacterium]